MLLVAPTRDTSMCAYSSAFLIHLPLSAAYPRLDLVMIDFYECAFTISSLISLISQLILALQPTRFLFQPVPCTNHLHRPHQNGPALYTRSFRPQTPDTMPVGDHHHVFHP